MTTSSPILGAIFSELVDGANDPRGAFVLNSGDVGLLQSLDKLSAEAASHASHGGATIAAHAEHLRYGLSLLNQWAREGGNPFASARWEEAWKTSVVTDERWAAIRAGLREQAVQWREVLKQPREVADVEMSGMIGSVAHLAYHLGAMRQIDKAVRGPRDEERRH
jgi:hypothetical protein